MRRRIRDLRSRVEREQLSHLTPMAVTRWLAAAGALASLATLLVGAGAGYAGTEQRAGTIAFLRAPAGIQSAQTSLFVVRADGTGLRRLTSSRSRVYAHAWSPDGSLIAYTDGGSLWLVRPDGTGRRRLASRTQMNSRALAVTWAPDGKALAVGGDGYPASQAWSIYVVPTDGGAPRRLPVDDAAEPSVVTPRRRDRIQLTHGCDQGGAQRRERAATRHPPWNARLLRASMVCRWTTACCRLRGLTGSLCLHRRRECGPKQSPSAHQARVQRVRIRLVSHGTAHPLRPGRPPGHLRDRSRRGRRPQDHVGLPRAGWLGRSNVVA